MDNPSLFIKNLVSLFYPLVEATWLDAEGAIKEISNPFSNLKEDQECDLASCSINETFSELLGTGRHVKSVLQPFHKGKQRIGYLRIRYDLTHFKNLQEQLQFVVQPDITVEKMDPWKHSIDQVINQYLSVQKLNLSTLSSKQMRELISQLQKNGLLDFKESSAYVASKLQVSRATVYNYLKTSATLKKVRIHQVDAFTTEKFGGNPAGVVLDADELDELTMRKIARELNLSETAFVLPSKKGTFKLRYFTPTGHEIIFCGHSTVGALYMIAHEKRYGVEKSGKFLFNVETPCGNLEMEAQLDEEEEIKVAYEAPAIHLKPTKISIQEIADAAGFDLTLIDSSYPVMYEATNKDLYLVARSLEDLKKIECNPRTLSHFSKLHDVIVLCVLAPEAFDKKNQFHMRCFAPLVGIPEDPFTGSVLGGLAAYVDTFKLLPKGLSSFQVEQGHFIERPGVVKVEFSREGKYYRAKVFAQAVHCFSTEINLT